jgi:ribosome-associated protein YbcJ (S4-like RNA binding protein)
MDRKNVILTGLPRSGTTLTCHLLNKLPDTVALHEPMNVTAFPQLKSHEAICDEIYRFFMEMRKSILNQRIAISKQVGGKVPDNPVSNRYSESGLRRSIASPSKIAIDKKVSPDFLLVIKHPSAFTATLESLVKRFPCYAVIRNPLSVLTSWNSVSFPVETGHAPAAETLDLQLKKTLSEIEDKIERQLHLLSWFFGKFHRVLPDESILRYEHIVSSGGKALSAITSYALLLNENLENKNKNILYHLDTMKLLGERLLNSKGAYWEFYSKENIESLLT